MVITHDVVDIARWLEGKDERAAALGSVGRTSPTTSPGRSNRIAVTADIHDMDALRALLDSPPPEVAALMEAHGVLPPLTVVHEK